MNKDSTREKILNAASDVFCEKGFENTTVRDICTAADANVAAVNYHFGDKLNLYYQVLQLWMSEFIQERKVIEEGKEAPTPEERIRIFIRSELWSLCTFAPDADIKLRRLRMLLREVTNEHHDPEVFECHKQMEQEMLFPAVAEIIGPCDDPKVLEQACIATTAMTTHYFIMLIHNPDTGIKSEADLDFMTDYLTTFILGGLKTIKEQYNG